MTHHVPTSARSKKLLAFLVTSVLLVAGAFFVPASIYSPMSIALTSVFGAFAASNVWAGRRAQAADEVIEPNG